MSTTLEILVPVIYEVFANEMRIDSKKLFELIFIPRKIESLTEKDKEIIPLAQQKLLNQEISKIKDKIRADIEKVRIEIQEIGLEKKRAEVYKKISEINNKCPILIQQINRKRSSGMRWEKEKKEYDELTKKVNGLKEKLREVLKLGIKMEFGKEKIVGGCLYVS